MPLADFMTLYNDPAKRPIIIDVRAKEAFDSGHIAGAISFPESDVDTRISELPKDKLVVAYCQ
jgi:rhodanese-related sulfurtransferase